MDNFNKFIEIGKVLDPRTTQLGKGVQSESIKINNFPYVPQTSTTAKQSYPNTPEFLASIGIKDYPQSNVLQAAKTAGSMGGTLTKPGLTQADLDFQKEYNKQLNKLYGQGMKMIEGQISRLQQYQPQYLQQLAATYESQIPELQRITEQGRTAIGEQETGTKRQRETSLAEARRTYEQGVQRGQQLFGGVGGSSAGQAFADIASQQLLKGTGEVMSTSAENLLKLQNARRDLDAKLQADLAKLDLDKKTALIQAQNTFRQELDKINEKKYDLQTQKANAQLTALKDFNKRRTDLEDFYTKQQSELQLYREKLAASTAASASSAQNLIGGINLADFTDNTSRALEFKTLYNQPEALPSAGLRKQTIDGRPALVQVTPTSSTFVDVDPESQTPTQYQRLIPVGTVFFEDGSYRTPTGLTFEQLPRIASQ